MTSRVVVAIDGLGTKSAQLLGLHESTIDDIIHRPVSFNHSVLTTVPSKK